MTTFTPKEKNWIFSEQPDALVKQVQQACGVSRVTAKTALNRAGDAVIQYLDKNGRLFYDPFLLSGMEEAVNRIRAAIANGECIFVYGDYDVDGITSTYMLTHYLRTLGGNVSYYIPDRMDEGYGLSKGALKNLKNKGAKLIVTVDLGISAIEEAKYCKTLGLDLVVTDHHSLLGDALPDCIAVVNPKIPSGYPFSNLAGAGVALKLISALCGMDETVLNRYLPFAAIGTIADLVELTDENRSIAKHGLEQLRHTQNTGLLALFSAARLDIANANAASIAFGIGPRLNAAGRISSANVSVDLLFEQDAKKAQAAAEFLETENQRRKQEEARIVEEAMALILKDALHKNEVIVVAKEGWHHGVIGIAASRITELFYKPCIVISLDKDGVGKASGRSIKGFHLFEALDHQKAFLEKYGGHALAAGLTILRPQIAAFDKAINEYAKKRITPQIATPTLTIDDTLELSQITLSLIDELRALEPCGMGNRSPVFCVKSLQVADIRALDGKPHAFLTAQKGGYTALMPAFGLKESLLQYSEGDMVDVAGVLSLNEYNGVKQAQFLIKDIRPARHAFLTRETVGIVYSAVKNHLSDGEYHAALAQFAKAISFSYRTNISQKKLMVCLLVMQELSMVDFSLENGRLSIWERPVFYKSTSLDKSPCYMKFAAGKGA